MAAPMKSSFSLTLRLLKNHHFGSVLSNQARFYLAGNRNILKLHERGIFENVYPEDKTPDLLHALVGSSQCVYCGFDPTADSLHIGNLMTIMALLHCQRAGHQPLVVLGGATAPIGDPSGKTKERDQLDLNSIEKNVMSIQKNIVDIFGHHQNHFSDNVQLMKPVVILNNAEWYAQRNVIEFLSTVGGHFRMGQLLSRHSVKSRLSSRDGLSFKEFTYQVFQSYDWLHLYRNYNCNIQIGGNDQIGNITAGHDLINRITKKHVFGLTVPLITTSSGEKLGKTANNAVWLSQEKTTPYEFYQFLVQRKDEEVEQYLKMFTFLKDEEIQHVLTKHKKNPENWGAQKKLAAEVTKLVHGDAGLEVALRCTKLLYENSTEALLALHANDLQLLFSNTPTVELMLEPGTTVKDVLLKAKCFKWHGDADQVTREGGVYINLQRETNPEAVLIPGHHILPNNMTLVRIGRRKYHLVKWFA